MIENLAHSLIGIPPGFVLILAGFSLLALRGRARAIMMIVAPLVTMAMIWQVPDGVVLTYNFLGYELVPLQGDTLSRLFATVFAIMTLAGAIYALNQKNLLELVAAFSYAGSAIGVTFAGDLITVFVFWELMAIGSTLVVWCGSGKALAAGMRYGIVHLFGGVLLMAGVAGHIADTNSIAFVAMETDSWAHWLLIAGFLINAGAPPLAAWLPDAYPEASFSGTVFLSAFTTKTAVYVLIRGFPGAEVLIFVGLYMVYYGIIYGILENDFRRILSYSLVNQVGFMVTAIGIGSNMALNGAAAHAFTHIIYKALLLMAMGSVMYMTGKRKCSDVGGLFRTMPVTAICSIVGGLSISAFPLTSGFISKSMISQGAADAHMTIVWILVTAAAVGVFIDVGLKLQWYVFFQKDSGLRPNDPPWNMRTAMIFFAVLCVGMGIFPGLLYEFLPFPVDYIPYTAQHVVSSLQLLLFGALGFFLVLPLLKRSQTITLDFDWFYRGLGRALAREFDMKSGRAWAAFAGRVLDSAERFVETLYRHHGPRGIFARTWPTGNMAFWTTVLLAGYLIVLYL
ncbi:MAG: Na(+)/H(+) antiporter subunit D [Fimbriimonadaceae bacterium]|nr:Na(+)/H(+) antiporter subunit D [Alphaproteobacteria bacterium]